MKIRPTVAALCFAFFAATVAAADLFGVDDTLEITLTGPITETIADRTDEAEQREFVLSVAGIDVPVQVHTRGKFRRKHCSFPPLRLNFRKKTDTGSPFDGQDKLKLVTHCETGRGAKHNVVEEYLVYRLFNHMTDKSYRARWLNVTYVDKDETQTHVGFVIESKEALAERLGGTLLKVPHVDPATFDPEYQAFAAIFQYAVGNTDFSFIGGPGNCCHNSTPITIGELVYPIPYDFDRTGLVGASYLVGGAKSREPADVEGREYRGYCTDDATWAAAAAPYAGIRREFLSIVDEMPDISGFARSRAKEYLQGFFKMMARRGGKPIARGCRAREDWYDG